MKLKPIDQQVIIITGASSGIGLVTARMCAQLGAKVVLAARNEKAITQLAEEINSRGGQALAVVADVGREEDVNRIAQEAFERFGGFDTWVNNAGVSIFGHVNDVTIDDMKRMFDTNFWGVVYGSRAAIEQYKSSGQPGSIINVGSFFGDRATVLQSTYSASKHALHGWTEAMRMELEKQRLPISVTLVHPGRIDTPYNDHARSYMEKQPVHRGMIYQPEAVAEAIVYAAAHPTRDMFVGTQAKALKILSALAPRLVDKIMEWYMYPTQKSKTRPSSGPDDNGLHHPGYGLKERGTHEGWVRGNSLYVKATKHRAAINVALVGLGLGLYLLWKPGRSRL